MSAFVALRFLSQLAMPPASLALGFIVASMLWFLGRRRGANLVALLAVGETMALSIPTVAAILMRYLEDQARVVTRDRPACCYDYIVVLGGSIGSATPENRFPSLGASSDRIWQAAMLYREGVAPRIVVTGASLPPQQGGQAVAEAVAMRFFLFQLGVPSEAIVVEDQALNTIENMQLTKALVGNGRVALVTSAYHMPRAMAYAKSARLNAAAFPVDFSTSQSATSWWDKWIPSVGGIGASAVALHEILALAFDRRDKGTFGRDEFPNATVAASRGFAFKSTQ
jgi:uncharacterized SAM-binding protein YcdF (DUF218 family)